MVPCFLVLKSKIHFFREKIDLGLVALLTGKGMVPKFVLLCQPAILQICEDNARKFDKCMQKQSSGHSLLQMHKAMQQCFCRSD